MSYTDLTYVPGEGPSDANFMVVGEAPGFEEEKQRRPFVGASGKLLRYSLDRKGLEKVYITNVCHYRPPGNDIRKFAPKKKSVGRVPNELVTQGLVELYRDIARVKPKVIIPVGNLALWALTGQEDISRRRGSIYAATLDMRRAMLVSSLFSDERELSTVFKQVLGTKVIPTWHPAAVLRMYNLKPIFEYDLSKAKRESRYPDLRIPRRDIIVDPERDQAVILAQRLLDSGRYACDIETPRNRWYCTGYSCDPSWSLVLSTDESWKVELHKLLLTSNAEKTFQNGLFDTSFLLYHEGIDVKNYVYDTMYAMKTVYAEFKAGLDFIASFLTDEPYYKDEGKDQDLSIASDAYEYMRYCGKDACVTREADIAFHSYELKKGCYREAVDSHMQLLEIGKLMMARGIRIDLKILKEIRDDKIKIVKESVAELDQVVFTECLKVAEGRDKKRAALALKLLQEMKKRMESGETGFNVSSNKDVMNYLYNIRGFKEKTNKHSKRRTADEKALKELYGETLDKSLLIMVRIRKAQKVLSNYTNYKFAPKGRLYYSVNPVGTKTQRWSSGQTIVVQIQDKKRPNKLTKTGANAQTIPPELRKAVIPDKGYVLFYADLSQVEDRIVAAKGNVTRKLKAFAEGTDAHALTASGIFRTSVEEVLEEAKRLKLLGKVPPMRYMGKQSNHAFNYDEGPKTFMMNVNKYADETGIRISFQQAKAIREAHHAFYPEIRSTYHAWIKEEINRSRRLRNPFGYEREFHGRVPDDSTYRDAYSWYPQSTAPEIINRAMVRIHHELTEIEILLHVHDAILAQVPERLADSYKPEIIRLMDEPVYIDDKVIHVPVDIKFGERWSILG